MQPDVLKQEFARIVSGSPEEEAGVEAAAPGEEPGAGRPSLKAGGKTPTWTSSLST